MTEPTMHRISETQAVHDDPENEIRPVVPGTDGRKPNPDLIEPIAEMVAAWEKEANTPFVGVTAAGTPEPGLFDLRPTGVPTAPIVESAVAFLDSLDAGQRAAVERPVDSDDWRRWSNVSPNIMRHGVLLEDLSEVQRTRALDVVRQTLSVAGYRTTRDVMRVNHTIAELTGHWDQFGEWLYWLSLFGTPSEDRPWGWQIDGHHVIINTFVLGDRIVTTPMFLGSEPVVATSGKYAGIELFREEERQGYDLLASLTAEQRTLAVLGTGLPAEVFTTAFRDNFEMRYEGIPYGELSAAQQAMLLQLVEVYVGRTRPGHAAVKMAEVRQHLHQTYFAWIGGLGPDAVFYYRVHSPVVLIEFDHIPGIGYMNAYPTRRHIHTVVRTPNGNDYGKDLLRLHYEQAHGTTRGH